MKLLVVSDIHGSYYYAKKIEETAQKENPDKVILLGDLYYHGPRNPLSRAYSPMDVANVLNKMKDKILCVKGNCDAEVDEMISEFKLEDHIRMEIDGKKYFFTHGHKYNIDNMPNDVDVLVYGHFHINFIKEKDGVICINPGSISSPKGGSKNSYLIIENGNYEIKEVE